MCPGSLRAGKASVRIIIRTNIPHIRAFHFWAKNELIFSNISMNFDDYFARNSVHLLFGWRYEKEAYFHD
jgi:hypothetical protein